MRLTTFTDYSLRVLMYLAVAPEGRATIAEIARAFDISESHLVKVVHFLGKESILANTRGRGGGLRLARPAHEINIGRVVRLTEGAERPAECFDPEHNDCRLAGRCALECVLVEAVAKFYETLDRYSLEDVRLGQATVASLIRWHPPSIAALACAARGRSGNVTR